MPSLAYNQGRGGVQFYDTYSQLILSNITFRNYNVHKGVADSCIYFFDIQQVRHASSLPWSARHDNYLGFCCIWC